MAQVIWISGGSLYEASQGIAFFLGAGGMMVMFYRWRWQGDSLAKVLCLTTFGTWALAVMVGSVGEGFTRSHPSFWIAGLALLIGIAGEVLTLARIYLTFTDVVDLRDQRLRVRYGQQGNGDASSDANYGAVKCVASDRRPCLAI
ncbi:hypothetical protein [Actinomadura meridiana]|uniref:hypothetical protein n=1 Tax=Actinomadura meridiana TaxID=559626 RepID=UPI0031E5023A